MINGVRYLDIRVAYYKDTDEVWWVNHGVVPIHPLQTVFDDVKTFLRNTHEIVILDFHEFPVGKRKKLVVCYIIPYCSKVTLQHDMPGTEGRWSYSSNHTHTTSALEVE